MVRRESSTFRNNSANTEEGLAAHETAVALRYLTPCFPETRVGGLLMSHPEMRCRAFQACWLQACFAQTLKGREASSTGRSPRQPPVETSAQSTGFREVTDRAAGCPGIRCPLHLGQGGPPPPRRLPHSRVCLQVPKPKPRRRSVSSPPTLGKILRAERLVRLPDFFLGTSRLPAG